MVFDIVKFFEEEAKKKSEFKARLAKESWSAIPILKVNAITVANRTTAVIKVNLKALAEIGISISEYSLPESKSVSSGATQSSLTEILYSLLNMI